MYYDDIIMSAMASQIISPAIVYSTIYSGTDERKHQGSASLAFVRGIHRWPVNSQHKWSVTRKMFLFDDVIMNIPAMSVLLGTNCMVSHLFTGSRAGILNFTHSIVFSIFHYYQNTDHIWKVSAQITCGYLLNMDVIRKYPNRYFFLDGEISERKFDNPHPSPFYSNNGNHIILWKRK